MTKKMGILILLLLIVSGGLSYAYLRFNAEQPSLMTYTNHDFGFSLSYPIEYEVSIVNENWIKITSKEDSDAYLKIAPNFEVGSVCNFNYVYTMHVFVKRVWITNSQHLEKTRCMDELPEVKEYTNSMSSFEYKDNFYLITFNFKNKGKNYEPEFRKILESIKFED